MMAKFIKILIIYKYQQIICSLNKNVLQCNTQTKVIIMSANQLVQARIDGNIKAEASIVLEAMGLTISDAVRMLLTKIAKEHALPFDPLMPNETTIQAIKEARTSKLPQVKNVNDLMKALNADD